MFFPELKTIEGLIDRDFESDKISEIQRGVLKKAIGSLDEWLQSKTYFQRKRLSPISFSNVANISPEFAVQLFRYAEKLQLMTSRLEIDDGIRYLGRVSLEDAKEIEKEGHKTLEISGEMLEVFPYMIEIWFSSKLQPSRDNGENEKISHVLKDTEEKTGIDLLYLFN